MKVHPKIDQTTSKKRSFRLRIKSRNARYFLAFALVVSASAILVVGPRASAAACAAPSSDLGTDTITVSIPAAGTYAIWTRMQAPDTTHNAINLQVDSSNCYNVGGGSFTATSWTTSSSNWVNYTDGNTSAKVSLALTAGTHTLKYIGTQAGVMVDKVVLTTDTSCTPVGAGSCPSGDSTPPTVNLVSPANGASITGSVNMTATASDNSGTVSSVKFLVDGQAVGTDTTSPFSVAWNSATVSNGTHTVTAQAFDPSGNTGNSTGASVTVSNAGGGTGKIGDVNGDGQVNLTDVSIAISHWKKTGQTKSQGDVNGDGQVNLTDISIIVAHWKQ